MSTPRVTLILIYVLYVAESRVKSPVPERIQKAIALLALAPRQKIEDTFHARGSLAEVKKMLGRQSKDTGWRQRQGRFWAVAGYIGTWEHFGSGRRVWMNMNGIFRIKKCRTGICSRLAAYIAPGAIIVRRNPRGPPPLLRPALSH